MKLRKNDGRKAITTIVPIHRELAPGTLKGVLELAGIDIEIFWKKIKG